jgi:hypothetical protein
VKNDLEKYHESGVKVEESVSGVKQERGEIEDDEVVFLEEKPVKKNKPRRRLSLKDEVIVID